MLCEPPCGAVVRLVSGIASSYRCIGASMTEDKGAFWYINE